MLKRIYVDNFRALVNFELRPEQLSLFLGDNGSGKSTLFNVLGALGDQIVRGMPCRQFIGTRTKTDTREVQRFELEVEGNGGTYKYVLEVEHPEAPANPFIRSEAIAFDGRPLYRFSDREVQLYKDDSSPGPVFPFGRDLSFLPNVDDPGGAKQVTKLGWFKSFVGRIRVIQLNPFNVEAFTRTDADFLARDGRNLASFFSYLNAERPEARTELEQHLKAVLTDFQNLLFRRVGDAKYLLASFVDSKQVRFEFDLTELSEGQRVILVLYAAVCGLLGDGSLLCFDEPDNFVSLAEIQPWLQTLRDVLAERGGQAMIISHHPEAIDYLATDYVLRFERPSGAVIARPIDDDDKSGLKLSEIVARGG